MARLRTYTAFDREFALAVLRRLNGSIEEAAKLAAVEENALRYWADGRDEKDAPFGSEDDEAEEDPDDDGILERPFPEEDLALPDRYPVGFAVAKGMDEWVTEAILNPAGPIHNPDHWYLRDARIGYLWTNAPYVKNGYTTAGTMELVATLGDKWQTAQYHWHLQKLFGMVPDFIMRLDAVISAELGDRDFCALVDHELYHATIKFDDDGSPRMTPDDEFIWAILGHHCTEHVPIVSRYGSNLRTGGSREIIAASKVRPEITDEMIAEACGTGKHNPFFF